MKGELADIATLAEADSIAAADRPCPAEEPLPDIEAREGPQRYIVDDMVRVLKEPGRTPRVFQYARSLVCIEPSGQLLTLSAGELTAILDRAANFWIKTPSGGRRPIPPPREAVSMLLSELPRLGFPELRSVVSGPVLLRSGEITLKSGFYAKDGVFYTGPDVDLPSPISHSQAVAALKTLSEPFEEFPFEDDSSEAALLSLIFTLLTRPFIDGATPMFAFDAATMGTGKSLSLRCAASIALGRAPAVGFLPSNEAEAGKLILTYYKQGAQCVCFDEVQGRVASVAICTAVTAWPSYNGRVLGQSQIMEYPATAVWTCCGNNLQFGGDMARRVVRIRLVSNEERPWRKEGFRHPDLWSYVCANRETLLQAALTVVSYWVSKGCPLFTNHGLGNFERWSKVVGGILECVGVPGFLANLGTFEEQADDEGQAMAAFYKDWSDSGTGVAGVSELLPIADENEDGPLSQMVCGDTPRARRTSLGMLLRRHVDAVHGDYVMKSAPKKAGAAQYRLEPRLAVLPERLQEDASADAEVA